MRATIRKTLCASGGYELVEYCPAGERRVEHHASKTCSPWLSHDEVSEIVADPVAMETWACDLDVDVEDEE